MAKKKRITINFLRFWFWCCFFLFVFHTMIWPLFFLLLLISRLAIYMNKKLIYVYWIRYSCIADSTLSHTNIVNINYLSGFSTKKNKKFSRKKNFDMFGWSSSPRAKKNSSSKLVIIMMMDQWSKKKNFNFKFWKQNLNIKIKIMSWHKTMDVVFFLFLFDLIRIVIRLLRWLQESEKRIFSFHQQKKNY